MRVTICDVGPRDGLQNEEEILEPTVRAELVNRLAAAGLPRIEAASFVRPDAVPQMAGAEEVVAAIDRRDGTEYSGLALNDKGYERLVATGKLDRGNFTLAATETFNRRNGNQSLEEAQTAAQRVVARSELPVTVTISCSFGCPFEGRVDPGVVAAIAARFAGSPPAQHAQHRLCQRAYGSRSRRDPARCLGRRPRRLPVRAPRDREHRHGGPRLSARG